MQDPPVEQREEDKPKPTVSGAYVKNELDVHNPVAPAASGHNIPSSPPSPLDGPFIVDESHSERRVSAELPGGDPPSELPTTL